MSFKANDTVTLNNYEEYFVLYVDDELTTAQKAAVESFVAQHPQLADELNDLLSTKLPVDHFSFDDKEALLAPAMKAADADENLLLYLDDELPPAERVLVAGRIEGDKEYGQQYHTLLQTKLDASEAILYPNKKELYRHEGRKIPVGFWLRIAAAVILLLTGTWFFVFNKEKEQPGTIATNHQPIKKATRPLKDKPTIVEPLVPKTTSPTEETVLTKQAVHKPLQKNDNAPLQNGLEKKGGNEVFPVEHVAVNTRRNILPLDTDRPQLTPVIPSIAVHKTFATPVVTTLPDSTYNKQNGTQNNPEVEWAVETKKKAPARGFFRKVSRFIERNTGIGTVSDGNELLVGSVALKLK